MADAAPLGLGWPTLVWVAAALGVLALLVLARGRLSALSGAVFFGLGDLFEGFGGAVRAVGRGALAEAARALRDLQRAEVSGELAARQRELSTVLARFEGLAAKSRDLARTVETAALEGGADRTTDRALVAVAAELAAADDRFARAIEYVDRHREVFASVHAGPAVSFSPFVRLGFALLFLPLIVAGGALNFFLIERPLQMLFAESGYRIASGLSLAEAGAATLVVMEAVVGFFLLEAVGITRVLPNFHDLRPRARTLWASGLFVMLAGFAVIEASLAVWREDLIALEALVAGGDGVDFGAAPLVVQVALGLLMPFVLALAAIPIEAIVKNLRIVGLYLAGGAMLLLAAPLLVIGAIFGLFGRIAAAALGASPGGRVPVAPT